MTKQTLSMILPPTRRDAVVERLREDIINGTLRPGEVLKDVELASRFGFSITPIREALTQLASEGLVEMPPNRSKRVAPLTRRATLESLALFRVLSLAGYEWGLPRLSQENLQQLHAADEASITALRQGDTRAAFRADITFHDVIIRAGGNHQLRRMLAANIPWIERLVVLCFPQGMVPWIMEARRPVLAAIERGDLTAALEAYRESIDHLQRAVEALPDSNWSDEQVLS